MSESVLHAGAVIRRCLVFVGWTVYTWSATLWGADGVIYYNSIPAPTAPAALRRVNGDGSNDQAVLVNLPADLYPTASRDGRRLLLTSPDPGRPYKISNNVFVHDLASAAVARVTSYEDVVTIQGTRFTNNLGQTVSNRVSAGYTINFPYHKAFSPDGSRIVVMNLRKTGSTSLDTPTSSTNDPGQLGAISGRIPVVEVFGVADGQPIGSYIYLGVERTGFNQGGDGVDWHPTRDEIVATLSSDIPASGTAGRTGMEGTLLALFTPSGPLPFLRKLTAPRGQADFFFDGGTLISISFAQHDYAPSISFDGQRVAYVRHTQPFDSRYDGAGIAPLPAQCVIRVINYDGSGDREVLRLADGLWVTKVAWSLDGSKIAFDLAPQQVLNGWNSALGDLTRSTINVVNVDGTNPHLLAPAPAALPTWAPDALRRPILRLQRDGDKLQLRSDQLVPGGTFVVEGSTDIRNWESLGTFTAGGATHFITITPNPNATFAVYRVRIQ